MPFSSQQAVTFSVDILFASDVSERVTAEGSAYT